MGIRDSHRMLPSIFGYFWHRVSLKKLLYKSEDLPVSSRPIQRRVTAVNQQASTGVIEGRNVIMTWGMCDSWSGPSWAVVPR